MCLSEGRCKEIKKRLGSGPSREKIRMKMSEEEGVVQLEDMAKQSKAKQREKRVSVSVGVGE